MFHQQIQLPEKHPDYPSLWRSLCGKWRIIRCRDDIQFIVQQFKRPTWRSDSYHVGWNSISLIHGHKDEFNTLSESTKTCSESANRFLWLEIATKQENPHKLMQGLRLSRNLKRYRTNFSLQRKVVGI